MKKYLKLMRIHHWIKNLLIFAPLFLNGTIFHSSRSLYTLVGFLSFCFVSSAIYIINDINDIEQDRLHSTKRKRPIASGEISAKKARILLIPLIATGISINAFVGQTSVVAGIGILLVYILLNIFYSNGMKNIPLLDVIILASGYFLRILYGSVISSVQVSAWLYLFVITGSLYLGFGKRKSELAIESDGTRHVLKGYTKEFLDKNMYSCMTLSLAFYSIWCLEKGDSRNLMVNYYLWSVPLVIVIWLKYSLIVEGSNDGDPVRVFCGDKVLMVLAVSYAIMMTVLIYMN